MHWVTINDTPPCYGAPVYLDDDDDDDDDDDE